jgi:O-antigen biosynthesis protein
VSLRDAFSELAERAHAAGWAVLRPGWLRLSRQKAPRLPDLREIRASEPLELPSSQSPAVSVIIPAYGQCAATWACVASICRARVACEFEVVVVDDCSVDETGEILSRVRGVRLVKTPKNLGFIGASNFGAEHARGQWICFLNNDTQVTPGWLDELVRTFALHPRAGLVGARLLYPDGRLQEAGGIVYRDGSAVNHGRFDHPDRPEYSYLRPVDYCSGACLVARAELFRDLGGFDAAFAPAYYEDTDLAFRVRQAGFEVLYQPLCRIFHHEGTTHGTDPTAGVKRHQLTNRARFRHRWQAVLASEQPPPGTRARAAADRNRGPSLLVVASVMPTPDRDSGSLRLLYAMELARSAGFRVSFVARRDEHTRPDTLATLQRRGIEVHYPPHVSSPQALLRSAQAQRFDAVMLCAVGTATALADTVRRRLPRARLLFDTVDLHFLRYRREAEMRGDERLMERAEAARLREVSAARRADATFVVSELELGLLHAECPDARIYVLSNIHEVCRRQGPLSARNDVLFIGGFGHPPNVDAVLFFARDVWPRLRDRLPAEARFVVAGSDPPEEIRALGGDRVVVTGHVPELGPYLDAARVSVAPLRFGAGVKGKINTAHAHGVPVVSTSIGVEGMGLAHERDVLVADEPEAMARAVVRAFEDGALAERLTEAGYQNVEQHFSRSAAERVWQKVLAEVVLAPR